MTCSSGKWAALEISDGTETIDLLSVISGFSLLEWDPAYPTAKGGGVFQSSPLSDGSYPVLWKWEDAVESFALMKTMDSQDTLFTGMMRLHQMLMKAVQYWTTPWQNNPVWIKARGAEETNARYAIIKTWSLPNIAGNPYTSPMFNNGWLRTIKEIPLAVTRGHWQAVAPGDSECLSISGTKFFLPVETLITEVIAGATDDAFADGVGTPTIVTGSTSIYMGGLLGVESGPFDAGLRFSTINIPQGTNIIRAWLEFVAVAEGGEPLDVLIFGQDTGDSATFSTYVYAWQTRMSWGTGNQVRWYTDETWVAGSLYYPPDVTAIVQEIINRSDWAANNAITFFFEHMNGLGSAWKSFASLEHATYAPATLYIQYGTEISYGQEATCTADSLRVVNKDNIAQLTHIYYQDVGAAAWSANLMAAALPFDLLPTPLQNGDEVYFIIDSTAPNSGPFNNLVMDISVASANLGTWHWDYWDGAAWSPLEVTDNSTTIAKPYVFGATGIVSFHWSQPTDWATTTVNGVTGWAVLLTIDTVAPGDNGPTLANRWVYTCIRNSVSIDDAVVTGDIPALLKVALRNQSDPKSVMLDGPDSAFNRIIAGLRSDSRGANFTSDLHFSSTQNPIGVTASDVSPDCVIQSRTSAPTGEAALYQPTSLNAWVDVCWIDFSYTVAHEFYGRYHAYARVQQVGGTTGQLKAKLRVRTTTGNYMESEEDIPETGVAFDLLDFGTIYLPPLSEVNDDEYFQEMNIDVYVYSTSATPDLWIYDIVLIPADEWIGDFVSDNSESYEVGSKDYLLIDSIDRPKSVLRSFAKGVDDDAIYAQYSVSKSGPIIAQANADQRLWFLFEMYNSSKWSSPPYISASLDAEKVTRYLLARGNK